MNDTYVDNLRRIDWVKEKTGLHAVTIYRRIKAGTFPPPVRLGPRRVAWREGDILKWQQSLLFGVKHGL